MMKWRSALALALAATGAGIALHSFLPVRFDLRQLEQETSSHIDCGRFPAVEVEFLRCGHVVVPECIAVRGACSFAPRTIAHSAVLIRHPHVTLLYDTGLCTDIRRYVQDQSFVFRQTLGRFVFERSIVTHLQERGLRPEHLDFILLSHLHWDHVSGIPDLPGVPLYVNRVEYEAARLQLFESNHNLVPRLMGLNPVELFDCGGEAYEGFRSSYDLLGDGSLILVPLPGHTAGNTGLFINRSNGPRLFLIGDAAWVAENFLRPAPFHPLLWSRVTSDNATALQTLVHLHLFSMHHPEVPVIAMHDAHTQEVFQDIEQARNRIRT